jgi:hypothetical protein
MRGRNPRRVGHAMVTPPPVVARVVEEAAPQGPLKDGSDGAVDWVPVWSAARPEMRPARLNLMLGGPAALMVGVVLLWSAAPLFAASAAAAGVFVAGAVPFFALGGIMLSHLPRTPSKIGFSPGALFLLVGRRSIRVEGGSHVRAQRKPFTGDWTIMIEIADGRPLVLMHLEEALANRIVEWSQRHAGAPLPSP